MAPNRMPTIARLRELLTYDPDTGEFRWLERPRTHFRTLRGCNMWNAKYAGTIAGTIDAGGYRRINGLPRMVAAHRLAWFIVYGAPVPPILDHIDHDKLNNRISNLRQASRSQNATNAKTRRDNATGVKGVHFSKKNGSFIATIKGSGQIHYLGSYATLEEAAAARRKAAERLHGEFARHE